ncbi:alkaline phosphatase D family protein [Sphingomonas hylomeconis]|uniref:Alkaline phosphatase D family protein n=1 Tax=Sphingomonas hylomeconis TaxID=1395958 RepID=A0ABV7SVT6_9SPHN|nr:alkaline phosphatase D family protein [Sphingomonas hylomeconis]
MNLDRRALLKATGQLAIFAGLSSQAGWAAPLASYPFTLGIASGDPAPDGFVLWTRLAPRPLEPGSGMPMKVVAVQWQVAEDSAFTRIVRSGEAAARPELGHSVHIEVAGLQPSRPYWYRFVAGADMSPAGTVRTAPAPGAPVDRVRIGLAGCQNYAAGYFTAYRHLAEESDLDAIFHYGDYIYEGGADSGCPKINGKPACVRLHDGDELYSLDAYRRRYALYKLDSDLQAAHRAAAFLSTYDDHEVDNNWAGAWDQDGTPPEIFLLRRYAAMQAWYENMPVRRAQLPAAGQIQMFRRIDYGDLLRVHLLDTRQYRTDQPCEPQEKTACRPATNRSSVQIIGTAQEKWLGQGMSPAFRWNLLAQQVMVMPFTYPGTRAAGTANLDSWNGYPEARARLIASIQARRLSNVVIATGDVHKHHAGVLPSRPDDLSSAPVATEFVGSSISSGGDGSDMPTGWDRALADNPHTKLVSDRRGYQLFDIGRKEWRTDVIAVDRVSTHDGARRTIASFVTVPERPGLELG